MLILYWYFLVVIKKLSFLNYF